MRRIIRLLIVAGSATAGLAFAGSALATPQLLISGPMSAGASGPANVEVKEAKEDAAPLHISIYMPTGYTANITQAAGTQIGTVHASLQALAISPDAIIDADGTVLVGDPTSPPLMTSATSCTGTAAHAAVWLLHVIVSGQTLDVPVYVDPTTGTETALGTAKLVLCLPDPYIPQSAGGAAFGAKIIDAKMTLAAGVITNPASSGSYLWRSVITPWNTTTPAPDLQHTVEAQSIVDLPSSASLAAKVKTVRHTKRVRGKKRTTVTNSVLLSGKLLEDLKGVPGASVTLFANGKKAATVKTGSSGAFAKTLALKKKSSFRARIVVPARTSACVSPLPLTSAPAGCTGATISGYTIDTKTVSATPKKR